MNVGVVMHVEWMLRLEGRSCKLEGRGHDQWYEQELEG